MDWDLNFAVKWDISPGTVLTRIRETGLEDRRGATTPRTNSKLSSMLSSYIIGIINHKQMSIMLDTGSILYCYCENVEEKWHHWGRPSACMW